MLRAPLVSCPVMSVEQGTVVHGGHSVAVHIVWVCLVVGNGWPLS